MNTPTEKKDSRVRKILIITSVHTGSGHKSLSDSLTEQFAEMPDTEVHVIDGFTLMGRVGIRGSRTYNFMLRRIRRVYNTSWRFTSAHLPSVSAPAALCSRRFMNIVRRFHPDLILTVHSLFNHLLTRMIEIHGLEIPVVVLQADIATIHSTWCNPKARMTICPTREAYEASLRLGMPPEKLKPMGFPVRRRFCAAAGEADAKTYDGSRPPRCLLMSGSEGSGRLKAYAKAILENTNAELTIVCGNNRKLRQRLQKSSNKKYGQRLNIMGFVKEMERLLLDSDLLIARGSPNTLFEAVTMRVPVIMIGPLPEQEKGNVRVLEEHHLGIACASPEEAPEIIRKLTADGAVRIKEIRSAQKAFRNTESAREIAEYTAELAVPLDYSV